MMADRPPIGADKYLDREVITSDGTRLGISAKLLKNRLSEVAEWMVVEAGLFGRKRMIIPIAGSELAHDHITIPYTHEMVGGEPHAEPDDETNTLHAEDEDRLNAYFGLGANAA